MNKEHFSFEEFEILFKDRFESQEELLQEYRYFLRIFDHLDKTDVPKLPDEDKDEIFKLAWRQRPQKSSWSPTWFDFLRQPAAAFAFGIIVGCIVMFMVMNDKVELTQTASAEPLLTVESTRYTETYKGKIIDDFYSEFENPKIVHEKVGESSPPQRTLYGTLDNGEIYVVWNM